MPSLTNPPDNGGAINDNVKLTTTSAEPPAESAARTVHVNVLPKSFNPKLNPWTSTIGARESNAVQTPAPSDTASPAASNVWKEYGCAPPKAQTLAAGVCAPAVNARASDS